MRDGFSFRTFSGTVGREAHVLSDDSAIDGIELPLRIEYTAPSGDKRIERFHPSEFKEKHYAR